MAKDHRAQLHAEFRSRSDVRAMTDLEIRRVQQVYLEMAGDLFEMFESCGIDVTLSGGSALGAVRHKGFIPWDDDLDLNVPRKDFEKLKQVFDGYFHGKYIFRAPNHHPHSGYRCGKIENPRVQVWDEFGRRHGLTVDVFIVENLPDPAVLRTLRGLASELYRIIAGLVFEYECARNEGNRGVKLPFKRKLCHFVGRSLSFRTSMKWYDALDRVNQYEKENTKMVGIPGGRKHYFGEMYQREWMMERVFLPFEGELFPVPKEYDKYLSQLYGNYQELPPEDKREHHYIRSIEFQ